MNYPVYYNGKILPESEASIPLTDRCIWFGDGIYEAAIGSGNIIFKEEEHISRLFRSAETIGITPGFSKAELSKELHNYIAEIPTESYFFLYFQCTRSSGGRVHAYPDNAKCNLLFTAKPYVLPHPETMLKLITALDRRYYYCNIKSLNLLPSVLAAKEAEKAGCDEAVFLRDGIVTECSHSNISVLKDGALYTHPVGDKILAGVAREQLIAICVQKGITVYEKPFDLDFLKTADEILITSSSRFAMRACELNGSHIGNRDANAALSLISTMQNQFLTAVHA